MCLLAPLVLQQQVVVAVLEEVLLVDLVGVGDVLAAVQLLECFRSVVVVVLRTWLAVAEGFVRVAINLMPWF